MRKSLLGLFAIIFSFTFLFACSREEQSSKPLRNDAVVKKPIAKPVEERLQPKPVLSAEKSSLPGPAGAVQTSEEKSVTGTTRVEPERRQAKSQEAVLKGDAGQFQPGTVPRAPSASSVVAPGSEEPRGIYLVNKGDTLAGISGKKEVYGDHLKWPILYRLNAEPLELFAAADNLPDLPLTDGMKLRTVTPEEKKANLEKRSGSMWVVNVLSAKTNAEAIPAVISLIRNGYPVYLANARVNEKDWIRVRVGFFKTRELAESEGKKIMGLLSSHDSWATKVAGTEFIEFAGF